MNSTPDDASALAAVGEEKLQHLSNMTHCTNCCTRYQTDQSLLRSGSICYLPVSCNNCGYTWCYECVKRGQQSRVETTENFRKCVDCPSCRKERSFHAEKPVINKFACQLLEEVHQLFPQIAQNSDADNLLANQHKSAPANDKTLKQEVIDAKAFARSQSVEVEVATGTRDRDTSDEEDRKMPAKSRAHRQHNTKDISDDDDNDDSDSFVDESPVTSKRAAMKRAYHSDSDSSPVPKVAKRPTDIHSRKNPPQKKQKVASRQQQQPQIESEATTVVIGKNLSLPVHAKHSGWTGFEQHVSDTHRPDNFQGVFRLMDFLFPVAPGEESFHTSLWINATSGGRIGFKTRVQLRNMKKQMAKGEIIPNLLHWHRPKAEYNPSTKADLSSFIELLMGLDTAPELHSE